MGDPINPSIGNSYQVETDYKSADGFLDFSRYYNSYGGSPSGAFGVHWLHSFEGYIEVANGTKADDGSIAPTDVNLVSNTGRIVRFTLNAGVWLSNVEAGLALFKDSDGWTLGRKSGVSEKYDVNGRLVAVFDREGNRKELHYRMEGLLERVVDQKGREIKFTYRKIVNSDYFISRVEFSDGSSVSYDYDNHGNLIKSKYSDGFQRLYHYGEDDHISSGGSTSKWKFSAMTGISEADLSVSETRLADFHYDGLGRATATSLSGGVEAFSIQYDDDGLGATITSPLMSSARYGYVKVKAGRKISSASVADIACSSCFASVEYDQYGMMGKSVDFLGGQTYYTNDERGLETSRTIAVNDTSGRKKKIKTTWHASFAVPTQRQVYNAADVLVAQSSWAYNVRGQALTASRTDPVAGTTRTSTTTYCEQSDIDAGNCPLLGLVTSVDGPRSDVSDLQHYTYYFYDDSTCASAPTTCPHRKGDLWKVTSALGQVTEYLSYDGAGRVLSVKDANGTITDYTYHPRGWLTASKVRGADSTTESDDRITLIDYWPTGLVKQVTQPDGAFTAFTYDAAHRLTDIADNAGNTLHYTLDNAGNRVKEDTKDASGSLKRTLSRVYNQLGQLSTQATASGDPTDFGYDANGNTTAVTDALGHKTQNDYDPLNRLASTLQDVGGIAADTKFGYDALDNLTKVTDPKGLDTTYAYNGLGDLTKLTSPDTGVTNYTYDSAGNRATQTDARNIKTTYSYDALNRLTKLAYPTTSLNVSYTYDVSQTTCASGETYAIGRLARMQDGSGSIDYCYDRFGDLVRKVQTTNGKVFVLRYAYTKAGQLSRLTYPDGAAVDYVRNAQGQTTEVGVTPAGGTRQVLLNNAAYYPFGPVASWSYGNGRPMQRVLDQDYRPLAINDTRSDGLSTGFAFDPAGNLSALTAAGNTAPVVSLDYDALGRLTAFKDGPTGTVIDGYSYDATGNRLSAKVNTATQSYTYPTTSHRLSAVAGTARTYDAIGNTLSIGGTAQEFAYDATGRMSQAKRAGTVVMKYVYNGRGEQVRRVDKTNTYTLYDESGHWLGNYDANGTTLQQAIWLDDLPVGVLSKNSLRYVQPDHLGTPRAVIDPTRDVAIWKWDLKGEAFGNTSPDQDPDKDGTAFVFDMRLPGQRYDAATGFNQNYFRDYDAGTGRYGQSDPIGLGGGLNTYGYSLQAPLDHGDALGLATWKGNSYGVGGGAGRYGGFIDFYQLTSPCPDGGLAYVYIMAFGGSGGIGYPISMTGSSVELSDANGMPDPNIFNGPYAKFSVGSVSFGPGYQLYQKIMIGGAWKSIDTGAKSSGWHQSQGGFDGSLYSVGVGKAIVIEKKECSKCEGG
ncbi:DUF6531 domain-containing protein [Xanthomonas translucens pv. undulosa]|nr:RHS repeat-associated core domain-containing protein [Xanthomonas translucens]UJB16075.1 DUF6531 domain-containing protein [Xanthomonas translucens pv. undulosa]